jgi:hypothetical protein
MALWKIVILIFFIGGMNIQKNNYVTMLDVAMKENKYIWT